MAVFKRLDYINGILEFSPSIIDLLEFKTQRKQFTTLKQICTDFSSANFVKAKKNNQ